MDQQDAPVPLCVCAEQGIICKWCTLEQMERRNALPPPAPVEVWIDEVRTLVQPQNYTPDEMRAAILAERQQVTWKALEPKLPSPVTLYVYTAEQLHAAILAERLRCASICRSRYMGDNTREDFEARACAEAILKG